MSTKTNTRRRKTASAKYREALEQVHFWCLVDAATATLNAPITPDVFASRLRFVRKALGIK